MGSFLWTDRQTGRWIDMRESLRFSGNKCTHKNEGKKRRKPLNRFGLLVDVRTCMRCQMNQRVSWVSTCCCRCYHPCSTSSLLGHEPLAAAAAAVVVVDGACFSYFAWPCVKKGKFSLEFSTTRKIQFSFSSVFLFASSSHELKHQG